MTTSATVHWLTGTTHLDETDVLDVIHEATGGAEFLVIDGTKWAYRKRYRTIEGIEVMVDPAQPETMPPVCVNVPGAGCEFLGADRLRQVASILKPTRVDFAWDGAPFTVAQVRSWIESGSTRTRFRRADGHETIMGNGGDGVTLGTAESTGQVVVYDRRGPVRVEMRLRGQRAEHAYQVLTLPPDRWAAEFLAQLRGLVDFVDRSESSRADRCSLLPSWEAFIEGAARVVVALTGSVAPSLDRTIAWFKRQVVKRMHMLDRAGVSIPELLTLGRARMRQSDRVLLAGWSALAP